MSWLCFTYLTRGKSDTWFDAMTYEVASTTVDYCLFVRNVSYTTKCLVYRELFFLGGEGGMVL